MPVIGVSLRSTHPPPPSPRTTSGRDQPASHGIFHHGCNGSHHRLEAEAPAEEERAIRGDAVAGLALRIHHVGIGEEEGILRRDVDAQGLRADARDVPGGIAAPSVMLRIFTNDPS